MSRVGAWMVAFGLVLGVGVNSSAAKAEEGPLARVSIEGSEDASGSEA